MILLDLGLVLDGYHSDMTRVLFHDKPDPVMAGLCSVVRRAHSAAVALCSPGTKIGALDEAARCVMREEGLEQYFTHSLGHGIGLITHEAPRIRFDSIDKDTHLTPGMVITIEPGLYLPNKGGVRWEDMILITETGHMNLTKGV
jgi:Xaa-Pro aminopeptidase